MQWEWILYLNTDIEPKKRVQRKERRASRGFDKFKKWELLDAS